MKPKRPKLEAWKGTTAILHPDGVDFTVEIYGGPIRHVHALAAETPGAIAVRLVPHDPAEQRALTALVAWMYAHNAPRHMRRAVMKAKAAALVNVTSALLERRAKR